MNVTVRRSDPLGKKRRTFFQCKTQPDPRGRDHRTEWEKWSYIHRKEIGSLIAFLAHIAGRQPEAPTQACRKELSDFTREVIKCPFPNAMWRHYTVYHKERDTTYNPGAPKGARNPARYTDEAKDNTYQTRKSRMCDYWKASALSRSKDQPRIL